MQSSKTSRDMDWETSTSTVGGGSSVCSGSACTTSSTSSSETSSAFKATQMWQELVVGFREGMPRHRRRVKMKFYEECFTGSEAVQWLHEYLQTSGSFGTVSKQQAVKLLQKFQQSEVIREVRGKQHQLTEDSSCRYSFVTEPGPFNFIEEENETDTKSPLGKRDRSRSCTVRSERAKENVGTGGGAFFANSHILSKIDESTKEEMGKGGGMGRRKSARLTLVDVNSGVAKPSPSQVADIWKELTLARLLRLIDMPTLDTVLSHDAVDGKNIARNVGGLHGFMPRLFRSSTQGHGRSHPSRPLTKASGGQEAVEDFPAWVITMLNCLAKWPEGCPADVVTGQPNTFGLESEVLQSLTRYLCALSEPLICTNLYGLHMAINSLLNEGKESAVDALQLCSLLLPQTNRTRVHRVLRTIHKASNNHLLRLSHTQSNQEVIINSIAVVVLRPDFSLECSEQDQTNIRNLVTFMSEHYNQIFKVPDDLKQQVDTHIRALSIGKDSCDVIRDTKSFCRRVSQKEYECQMKMTSQQSISSLLDKIASDENMTDREKKQRLKLFQQQYPDIYAKKFGVRSGSPRPSSPRMSFSRTWQFQSLRKRTKPPSLR